MSFDRVTPFYRTLERLVFGDQLQQARLAFLGKIEAPRRVLIVGEGTDVSLLNSLGSSRRRRSIVWMRARA